MKTFTIEVGGFKFVRDMTYVARFRVFCGTVYMGRASRDMVARALREARSAK